VLVPRSARTRFVVLFIGRVGSTYLITALDSHPAVVAEGERLGDIKEDGGDARAQLAWSERFLAGPLVGRHRARGFKTKLRDVIDLDGFGRLLIQADVRVITMQRRNEVKNAVSRLTAKRLADRTGRWNRYEGTDPTGPMVVDPAVLDQLLEHVAFERGIVTRFVEGLGLPSLEVGYENLLTRPHTVFEEVLSFLGAPQAPLTAETRKNTSDDLREVIENFAEVRAHYAGTRYEPMLDEVLLPGGTPG
jgi:hypothetical protein